MSSRQHRIIALLTFFLLAASGLFFATGAAFAQTPDAEERLYDAEYQLLDRQYDLSSVEAVSDAGDEASDDQPLVSASDGSVEGIVESMTLDEKIAQMIIPAIRAWNGVNVTELPADLAAALQKHQYGGIILFGANMVNAAQTANLANALQQNNAQIQATANIPYLVCADGEGGLVVRLASGTRMTGSMAVGATGSNGVANAKATGAVLGEELAAVGVNVDLAPDADVNSNPANPVIGTRSFSDDPNLVADLSVAFAQGLAESGVIGSYKHFPGHGDTGEDTHTGLTSVDKSYDELNATDLVPFRAAVANGADLIMTAHITLPQYDDEVELGDGTMGYYPATMSPKIIGELLRGDLGYEGVVITDALEMGAIVDGGLVKGERNSLEYAVNIAEKIINAGSDLLLLPTDMTDEDKVAFYDAYIAAIKKKVEDGAIAENKINQAVTRILTLKQRHGILELDTSAGVDPDVATAVVGSDDHRETELRIAREAITLLKNDDLTLPLSGRNNKVVIAGRDKNDAKTVSYALKQLQDMDLIPQDALVRNLCEGTTMGSADSGTVITLGYYYDSGSFVYADELKAAVAEADTVVTITKNYGLAAMGATNPQYLGASQLLADAHAAGARFVLLSDNLPYDTARYQEADAIMLSYMAAGLSDPTDSTGKLVAYNANVRAAIEALFDNLPPTGTLPVNIPEVIVADDGTASYGSEVLYARGSGMTYEYRFTKGAGGTHTKGTESDLSFTNNSRCDLLQEVLVDDVQVDAKNYVASAGSTNLTLKTNYLDTLSEGEHTLTTVHDYGTTVAKPQTTFSVEAAEKSDDSKQKDDSKKTDDSSTKTDTSDKASKSKSASKSSAKKPAAKPLVKTGDQQSPWALMLGLALPLVGVGLVMRRRENRL